MYTAIFVLFMMNYSPITGQYVTTTQEFYSLETCVAAAEKWEQPQTFPNNSVAWCQAK